MAQGNETATFNINLEGNAADAAKLAASSMEELKARIEAGQGAIKAMSANLRNLRGSTDEVKAAKDKLKAKLDAERSAVSGATVQLLKHNDGSKKAAGGTASLKEKLDQLKESGGAAGSALSALSVGMTATAAAIVALAAGIVAGGLALGRFIIKGADAARSAGLLREAAVGGNPEWGKNFGDQVEELAKKVPTSKAEIEKLGLSLSRSRIGGTTWVNTLGAVTQATAAMGDKAGGQIEDLILRGKEFGNFRLNPKEMVGTGVEFSTVAEALSKSMHIGVVEAQKALVSGRVKLADGAAAMKDAVEQTFGKLNLRQMLSLDNIAMKLGETFDAMTKDVNLEPMLKGFKDLADIFSLDSAGGKALKQIVEVFAKDIVGGVASSTPAIKGFIEGLILGAQQLVIKYLDVRNYMRKTFGDNETLKKLDVVGKLMTALKVAVTVIGGAIAIIGVSLAAAAVVSVTALNLISGAFTYVEDTVKEVADYLKNTSWADIGLDLIKGLVSGLVGGGKLIKDAVVNLGKLVKLTFTGEMAMKSPSKVFDKYGENTTEGYAQGVERTSDVAQAAVDGMVPKAPPQAAAVDALVSLPAPMAKAGGPGAAGAAGGGKSIVVNVGGITITASGENAKEVAAAVSSPSVLDQLTKAIIDAAQGSGAAVAA